MGWVVNATRPAALTPGKRGSTRCTGSCVGPRAVWTGVENLSPQVGFDPRTVST